MKESKHKKLDKMIGNIIDQAMKIRNILDDESITHSKEPSEKVSKKAKKSKKAK